MKSSLDYETENANGRIRSLLVTFEMIPPSHGDFLTPSIEADANILSIRLNGRNVTKRIKKDMFDDIQRLCEQESKEYFN